MRGSRCPIYATRHATHPARCSAPCSAPCDAPCSATLQRVVQRGAAQVTSCTRLLCRYHSKTFFMFLFLINLSNIIINIEGNGLRGNGLSLFTMHTLGNTASDGVLAKGGHSYAVMEFLTAGLMVAYLFFIRGEMETIYERVRGSGQKRKLAAADFTVMVGNVPASWGSARVREFFEKSFGDVVSTFMYPCMHPCLNHACTRACALGVFVTAPPLPSPPPSPPGARGPVSRLSPADPGGQHDPHAQEPA